MTTMGAVPIAAPLGVRGVGDAPAGAALAGLAGLVPGDGHGGLVGAWGAEEATGADLRAAVASVSR